MPTTLLRVPLACLPKWSAAERSTNGATETFLVTRDRVSAVVAGMLRGWKSTQARPLSCTIRNQVREPQAEYQLRNGEAIVVWRDELNAVTWMLQGLLDLLEAESEV